jgi:hypothetical protein
MDEAYPSMYNNVIYTTFSVIEIKIKHGDTEARRGKKD